MSVNTNSCASKGRSAVYGDDVHWAQLSGTVDSLAGKVFDALRSDPAYGPATKEWRTCMQGKGFTYAGPEAAREALDQQMTGQRDVAKLRATEVQVATADAECFQSTGMAKVVGGLVVAHEKKVADANEGVIVEFQELQQQSIRRAKTLVSGG